MLNLRHAFATFCFLLFAQLSVLWAQGGDIDFTFNPSDEGFGKGDGTTGTTTNLLLQPDGKIIIAGSLSKFDGTPINNIARLNVDGSLDENFETGTGPHNLVNRCVIQMTVN